MERRGPRKFNKPNYYEFCVNFFSSLNNQILSNLKLAGIETRPAKTIGLWCYLLLPMILLNYTIMYETTKLYQTMAFVSVGLFFYCNLFILFLSITGNFVLEAEYGGCMASSLISTILIYIISERDLLPSLAIALSSVWSFNILLKTVLKKCPKTFTLGEAMIVVQSIPLFVTSSLMKFFESFLSTTNDEYSFINSIVITILLSTVLMVAAIFFLNDENKTVTFLGYIIACGGAIVLFSWHLILGPKCLFLVFEYIFLSYTRLKLINFWLILLCMAILLVLMGTKLSIKANTMTRKMFHVLASMVFISGLLIDIPLTTLAAGVGLSLLLLVEALRISGIEKISPALQSAFNTYGDEKDSGSFAMTPIYLYVGLACPLVLAPSAASLDQFAGVLSVGIGDTVASCAGASFGKTYWPNSNRTLEGTAFNILSQIAVVYVLNFFDLVQGEHALIRTAIAATASGLVEAKTEQVDNLILPLITIIAFQSTWFLS